MQSNGFAESTGKCVDAAIRKVVATSKANWTEVFDRALATHNATPDETGYSPYEKVFGRQKPSMGIALPTDSLA